MVALDDDTRHSSSTRSKPTAPARFSSSPSICAASRRRCPSISGRRSPCERSSSAKLQQQHRPDITDVIDGLLEPPA